MAAVPERVQVRVPFVSEREHEILQVTMIRRADDKMAAGAKKLLRKARKVARSNEVLDYLGSDSDIKALVANRRRIVIYSELMEHQLGRCTLCEPNAVGAWLAAHYFGSAPGKLATERAITAPYIDDASRAELRA